MNWDKCEMGKKGRCTLVSEVLTMLVMLTLFLSLTLLSLL